MSATPATAPTTAPATVERVRVPRPLGVLERMPSLASLVVEDGGGSRKSLAVAACLSRSNSCASRLRLLSYSLASAGVD
jgi:hypothetical protein